MNNTKFIKAFAKAARKRVLGNAKACGLEKYFKTHVLSVPIKLHRYDISDITDYFSWGKCKYIKKVPVADNCLRCKYRGHVIKITGIKILNEDWEQYRIDCLYGRRKREIKRSITKS